MGLRFSLARQNAVSLNALYQAINLPERPPILFLPIRIILPVAVELYLDHGQSWISSCWTPLPASSWAFARSGLWSLGPRKTVNALGLGHFEGHGTTPDRLSQKKRAPRLRSPAPMLRNSMSASLLSCAGTRACRLTVSVLGMDSPSIASLINDHA